MMLESGTVNKEFFGTYALNQLKKVPKQANTWKFSIIANILPLNGEVGHWVAIKVGESVDNKPDVEYYDPLGELPQPDILCTLHRLTKHIVFLSTCNSR